MTKTMARKIKDSFLMQLDGFDFETLENDTSCIYGLTPDLTLNYVNPAWHRFWLENGGKLSTNSHYPIGTRLDTTMTEPQKSYFTSIYTQLFITGEVWQHAFECSSNDTY